MPGYTKLGCTVELSNEMVVHRHTGESQVQQNGPSYQGLQFSLPKYFIGIQNLHGIDSVMLFGLHGAREGHEAENVIHIVICQYLLKDNFVHECDSPPVVHRLQHEFSAK